VNLPSLPEHGGNVYFYARLLGVSPFEIIDLSSSVNPLIKDFLTLKEEELFHLLQLYPDPEALEIKSLIAERYRLKVENILPGNGSYELLQLLILNLPKNCRIFLPEPTFVGYRKIASLRSDLIIKQNFSLNPKDQLRTLEDFLKNLKTPGAIIICNPNNPSGTIFEKESLKYLISHYDNALFIIDEAFIDFSEENSLLKETADFTNLFVLRSLTKFYGLAGVRVGYLASSNPLLSKIKALRPEWSVNTLSQYLARKLLLNQAFKERSLKHFHNLKDQFERALEEMDLTFIPSQTNYYLLRHLPKGRDFFAWLLKEHFILIRPCENFYGLTENDFRVSLKDERGLRLFIEALREWLKAL
jgi:threonine-phosphate decarboxylase